MQIHVCFVGNAATCSRIKKWTWDEIGVNYSQTLKKDIEQFEDFELQKLRVSLRGSGMKPAERPWSLGPSFCRIFPKFEEIIGVTMKCQVTKKPICFFLTLVFHISILDNVMEFFRRPIPPDESRLRGQLCAIAGRHHRGLWKSPKTVWVQKVGTNTVLTRQIMSKRNPK